MQQAQVVLGEDWREGYDMLLPANFSGRIDEFFDSHPNEFDEFLEARKIIGQRHIDDEQQDEGKEEHNPA